MAAAIVMPQAREEPLVTECPGCATRFRVTEPQLRRARGKVRCGACLNVFDGVAHLTIASARARFEMDAARLDLDALLDELARPLLEEDTAPKAGKAPMATAPSPLRPPGPALLFGGYEESGAREPVAVAVPVSEDAVAPAAAVPDAVAPVATPSAAASPEPVNPAAPMLAAPQAAAATALAAAATALAAEDRAAFGQRRRRRLWPWLVVPAGCLLLAAQVFWYQFDEWSKVPQWRSFYQTACGILGCELPVQRDTSLLVTRNLAVRSDPDEPGLLRVNAVIVNEAGFPQPFPQLDLRFTTIRGILVAGRRYQPEEYLSGDASGMTLMPPRTPVQVELRIDDPGPEAVNYFLRLR